MPKHLLDDEAQPCVELKVCFVDKNGSSLAAEQFNFALLSASEVDQILDAVDAACKAVREKGVEADTFRRLCKKYTTSQRNESDHDRLFLIRYGDSENSSPLRDFLRDLPLGAFLRTIFKISYAELISIKNHLHDFARFTGSPKVDLRHCGKLVHLKGFELFSAECQRGRYADMADSTELR